MLIDVRNKKVKFSQEKDEHSTAFPAVRDSGMVIVLSLRFLNKM